MSRLATTPLRAAGHILLLLMTAALLGACAAGTTPKQVEMDPEITYALRLQKNILEKRLEFDQLNEDFLLTSNPVFLVKMEGTMARTRQDIDKARAFLDLQQPYHRGIARMRWQTARQAVRSAEKQLVEMLLIAGELHLLHGDREMARTTLERVRREYEGDDFRAYREKADLLLLELEGSGPSPGSHSRPAGTAPSPK